jgi:hypothetical protein
MNYECENFQENCTYECFFFVNGKSLCLICSESRAVLKEYAIGRHCSCKHKESYKNCVGASRRERVAALKKGGLSEKNITRKQSSDDSSALRASYRKLLTCRIKKAKLLPDGE